MVFVRVKLSALSFAVSAVTHREHSAPSYLHRTVMSLDEPASNSAPVVEITEGLDLGIIGIVRLDNLSPKMRQPCTTARFVCGDWKPSKGPFSFRPAAFGRAFA